MGWKYDSGAGLLKTGVGEGGLALSLFNFFKFYHFLHLKTTLSFAKWCYYAFKEKLFFSVTIILGKTVILSCLKMNLRDLKD